MIDKAINYASFIRQLAPFSEAIRSIIIPLLDRLEQLEAENKATEATEIRTRIQKYMALILKGDDTISLLAMVDNGLKAPSKPSFSCTQENGTSMNLFNIETNRKNFATAETKMFLTEWSNDFVHGPDSVLFVAKLADEILQHREEILNVPRITWKKPISGNLTLTVCDTDSTRPEKDQDVVMDGEFLTTEGRELAFWGKNIRGSKVDTLAPRNPYAKAIFYDSPLFIPGISGLRSFNLMESPAEMIDLLDSSKPLLLATLMEIITIALFHANEGLSDGEVLKLLGGIKNLHLPRKISDIFEDRSQLDIELLENQSRQGRSGMTLIPFKFRFAHQKTFSTGVMARTSSVTLARVKCGR